MRPTMKRAGHVDFSMSNSISTYSIISNSLSFLSAGLEVENPKIELIRGVNRSSKQQERINSSGGALIETCSSSSSKRKQGFSNVFVSLNYPFSKSDSDKAKRK